MVKKASSPEVNFFEARVSDMVAAFLRVHRAGLDESVLQSVVRQQLGIVIAAEFHDDLCVILTEFGIQSRDDFAMLTLEDLSRHKRVGDKTLEDFSVLIESRYGVVLAKRVSDLSEDVYRRRPVATAAYYTQLRLIVSLCPEAKTMGDLIDICAARGQVFQR